MGTDVLHQTITQTLSQDEAHTQPHVADAQPPSERMPFWNIMACTVAMCGVQVCYAAQVNQGTAELLLLGISERSVSFAWLAGPLSGLIVQPLVGRASDGCTSRHGRRRPFLMAGSLLTAASLLLFSNTLPLATFFTSETLAPKVALPLAICAFFLLDFSIQLVQAPLRALVTDVVPKPQRAMANAYLGVFSGLGIFLGGFLTSLELKELFPIFQTDVQALFAIASVILVITVTVCVLSTHEVPFGSYAPVPRTATESSVAERGMAHEKISPRTVLEALRGVPRPFWRVFAVQLCTWCGFLALFVYVNAWVGRNVFLGDGTAEPDSEARKTFERGVKFGGKGNALMSIITVLYAFGLPKLLTTFGIVPVYAFSQCVEAVCLLSAPLIRGNPGQESPSRPLKVVTLVDIGMFGIVWASTMGVPWTLVGDALESDAWYAQRVGLFQTLFNASQSFPQLVIAAIIAPLVLSASGNDPAFVMFAGGLFAALGAVLVVVLRVDIFDESTDRTNNDIT